MGTTAFLFPGQGAQQVGMGRAVCERSAKATQLYERASEVLGFDLRAMCLSGPKERLDATDVSQPALFVSSLAAIEWLDEERPGFTQQCEMAAGLSLGEYTALTFAGAFSFEDGLRLVQLRGQAMQSAANRTPSGMVSALLLSREQAAEVRDTAAGNQVLQLANFLCPGNTVLSGEQDACERAYAAIEKAGGKPIRLAVAGAFHTSLMRPADEKLAEALADIKILEPRIPVYSNVNAEPHTNAAAIRRLLVEQVVAPVLWEDCMRAMQGAGATDFYEIGTGKVLKGLWKRIDRKVSCESLGDD